MHLFYIPDIENGVQPGQMIGLPAEEAKHAIKVLRLQRGAKVYATNGKGLMLQAEIAAVGKKDCVIQVLEVMEDYGKRDYRVHIAVAPTKNIKRFEWFLEKATEMGIDEITPLIGFHSERREIKAERENKVITAAIKQSLKAYHPQLNPCVSIKDFLERKTDEDLFIAHLIDENQELLKNAVKPGRDTCVLVGPEGDFSKEELTFAIEKGYKAVSLGNTRLRTETAALAACFTINLINM